MIGPITRDEARRRVLAWHAVVMTWAVYFGDLPEWARGMRGLDATAEDVRRLDREWGLRLMFGTAGPRVAPRGIIDYARRPDMSSPPL